MKFIPSGMKSRGKSPTYTPKWRVVRSPLMPWVVPTRRSGRIPALEGRAFLAATLVVGILSGVLWTLRDVFLPINIALVYLLPVLAVALRWGIWPALYSAGLGVLAFEYLFVPPALSYTIKDYRFLISFGIFLAVALVTASLAQTLRHQMQDALHRESLTSSLYELSRHMVAVRDLETLLDEVARHVSETFLSPVPVMIALPDAHDQLRIAVRTPSNQPDYRVHANVLDWVYHHGEQAGFGENKSTELLYVPLKTEDKVHGVMCIGAYGLGTVFTAEQLRIIEALAGLAAVSIARIHYEEEVKRAHLSAESERLRSALLDSISHELRTPLATIIGSVTGLLDGMEMLTTRDQRELLTTIREGSMRMNRLVTNLLGMVRLESGMLRLNRQSNDMADMIGVALRQVQDALAGRRVTVNIPDDLPPVDVDDVLIDQVLTNLLSNAIKYSPDASEIRIDVEYTEDTMALSVQDAGIGIQPLEADKLFDKFYRSPNAQHIPGTGLGLAICKGIILAHGGTIKARRGSPRGTVMTIELPLFKPPEREPISC